MQLLYQVLLRSVLAVLIGGIIGSERGRHGRAAGMRTHILVCLGAVLTSMTSMYVSNVLGNNGDVFRISAEILNRIKDLFKEQFEYQVMPPKSGGQGNIGMSIVF